MARSVRQLQPETLLTPCETFKSLEKYRHELDRVESLADFLYAFTPELHAYAETLEKEDDSSNSRLRPN